MKHILAVCASIIMLACAKSPDFTFQSLSFDQALEKARAEKKPVLLDFYSPT